MPLAKCVRCKKIFSKISSAVCPNCQPDEDADFAKIHNAIVKFPGAKAEEIASMAGVEVECVLRMLSEGRLRYSDVGDEATCGRCGAPAISMAKRLCERCLVEMDRECAEAMRELKKDFDYVGASGKGSSSVLGEKRAELESKRASETLKRAKELDERAHPHKGSPTVAREARNKKGPRG